MRVVPIVAPVSPAERPSSALMSEVFPTGPVPITTTWNSAGPVMSRVFDHDHGPSPIHARPKPARCAILHVLVRRYPLGGPDIRTSAASHGFGGGRRLLSVSIRCPCSWRLNCIMSIRIEIGSRRVRRTYCCQFGGPLAFSSVNAKISLRGIGYSASCSPERSPPQSPRPMVHLMDETYGERKVRP